MTTQVFWSDPTVKQGNVTPKETELEFVKWTPKYLIVRYPPGSLKSGEIWRMGRNLVNYWMQEKRLRIEGDIPEWALIV